MHRKRLSGEHFLQLSVKAGVDLRVLTDGGLFNGVRKLHCKRHDLGAPAIALERKLADCVERGASELAAVYEIVKLFGQLGLVVERLPYRSGDGIVVFPGEPAVLQFDRAANLPPGESREGGERRPGPFGNGVEVGPDRFIKFCDVGGLGELRLAYRRSRSLCRAQKEHVQLGNDLPPLEVLHRGLLLLRLGGRRRRKRARLRRSEPARLRHGRGEVRNGCVYCCARHGKLLSPSLF